MAINRRYPLTQIYKKSGVWRRRRRRRRRRRDNGHAVDFCAIIIISPIPFGCRCNARRSGATPPPLSCAKMTTQRLDQRKLPNSPATEFPWSRNYRYCRRRGWWRRSVRICANPRAAEEAASSGIFKQRSGCLHRETWRGSGPIPALGARGLGRMDTLFSMVRPPSLPAHVGRAE